MKPDVKKDNKKDEDFSPMYPILLLGAIVIGVIVLGLRMVGVF